MFTRRGCIRAALAAAALPAAFGSVEAAGPSRSMVIVYSRTGETLAIARMIAEATGAELLRIEPKEPYAGAYSDMTSIAREEKRQGRRREIATAIPDLSRYERIYIGSPVWWNGLSTPMWTFLRDHPLEGRTVATFHSSGSSSASASRREAEALCPKARFIGRPFLSSGGGAADRKAEVRAWLGTLE